MTHQTCSVVIAYYRQPELWSRVLWGLMQNRQHIFEVIVVNDEPWDPDNLPYQPNGLTFRFLEHDHDGFGLTTSYNQGVRAAQTDIVLLTQGDQILAPGCLASAIDVTGSGIVTYLPVDYISEKTSLSDLEQPQGPEIIYPDWRRSGGWAEVERNNRAWKAGKGSLLIFRKADYQAIDGFDEDYRLIGPNSEDHDFAARWMMYFGGRNLQYWGTLPGAWHIGNAPPERAKTRLQWMPSYASRARLGETLGRYFHHRYQLFCGIPDTQAYQIGIDTSSILQVAHQLPNTADIRLDCLEPSWIPSSTAEYIYEFLPTPLLPMISMVQHLKYLPTRIAMGGELELVVPTHWNTVSAIKARGFLSRNGMQPIGELRDANLPIPATQMLLRKTEH